MQCATDLLICKNEDLCPDIWGIDTFLTPDCNEAVNRWHLTFLLSLMEWPLVKRYIALGLSHWDNSLSKNKFEILLCGPLIQEPHLSAQFHRIQSVDRVEKKRFEWETPATGTRSTWKRLKKGAERRRLIDSGLIYLLRRTKLALAGMSGMFCHRNSRSNARSTASMTIKLFNRVAVYLATSPLLVTFR